MVKKNEGDTGLSVRQIHIAFNVNEHERIVQPIMEEQPQIVYYFHYEGEVSDQNPQFREKNLQYIKEHVPSCEIRERGVSYADYYAIIGQFAKILSEEAKIEKEMKVKSKITVNLGTGSKMVAVAMMDAQRIWNKFNLIYPYSTDFDPKRKEGAHKGTFKEADVPNFRFSIPDEVLIKSLQIYYWLMKNDKYKRMRDFVPLKDWLDAIFDVHKVIIVKKNDDTRKYDSSKRQRMSERIIKPLKAKWGFIIEEKTGKTFNIRLTSPGKNFIKVWENYDLGLQFPKKTT